MRTTSNFLKILLLVLVIIATILAPLTGCSRKVYLPAESTKSDSVYVNSQKETRDSVLMTTTIQTVEADIPTVHIEEKVPFSGIDTTSVLTDGKYRSIARYENGMLIHTLESLPLAILKVKVPVTSTREVHEERADTASEKQHLQIQKVPYEVQVDKKLSWWQQLKIAIGGWTLIILSAIVIYYYIRRKV